MHFESGSTMGTRYTSINTFRPTKTTLRCRRASSIGRYPTAVIREKLTRESLDPAAVNATFRISWQANLIHVLSPVLCLLVLTGCGLTDWAHNRFKVGPEYRRPHAAVAHDWIEAGNAHLAESESGDPQWWSTLNDPVLDSLIEAAYGQNLTLREAGWRVMQARAARAIAAGNFFPQSQQAFGQYERILESESLATPVPLRIQRVVRRYEPCLGS